MQSPELSVEVLTLHEVARLLRVSRHTLYRPAVQGELPVRKAGHVGRFPKPAVEHYLCGRLPGAETASEVARRASVPEHTRFRINEARDGDVSATRIQRTKNGVTP